MSMDDIKGLDETPPFEGGHRIITWAALQALPAWQRPTWAPHAYALADEYSLYGDTYYTNKQELGPYVEMPDGTAPVCAVGVLREKRHYAHEVDYWESPFYDRTQAVLTYYLERIVGALREGKPQDAARFAGSAAHYIEDSGVPAHAADNGDLEFVKDYEPPPPAMVAFPLHSYTERSPGLFSIAGYQPRLFGQTPEEAGARYLDRYVELVLFARTLLLPIARCAYRGDDAAAGRLRLQAARMCAECFADYLFTATSIAAGRFEPAAVESLAMLKLTDRWPFRMSAWAPAPYFEPAPLRLRGINLDMARRPVPCEILVAGARGLRRERVREALGAGAYFEYHYRLTGMAFRRFTARVGIHATLGAHRPIDVAVKAGDRTVFKGIARPGEAAMEIDCRVGGCRDLRLIASGPRYTDPDGNDNHVVWARPRLGE